MPKTAVLRATGNVREMRGMMEEEDCPLLNKKTPSSLQFAFEFLTNAVQVDCSLVLDGEIYKLLCSFPLFPPKQKAPAMR
jgi:hypothetical protein